MASFSVRASEEAHVLFSIFRKIIVAFGGFLFGCAYRLLLPVHERRADLFLNRYDTSNVGGVIAMPAFLKTFVRPLS